MKHPLTFAGVMVMKSGLNGLCQQCLQNFLPLFHMPFADLQKANGASLIDHVQGGPKGKRDNLPCLPHSPTAGNSSYPSEPNPTRVCHSPGGRWRGAPRISAAGNIYVDALWSIACSHSLCLHDSRRFLLKLVLFSYLKVKEFLANFLQKSGRCNTGLIHKVEAACRKRAASRETRS